MSVLGRWISAFAEMTCCELGLSGREIEKKSARKLDAQLTSRHAGLPIQIPMITKIKKPSEKSEGFIYLASPRGFEPLPRARKALVLTRLDDGDRNTVKS